MEDLRRPIPRGFSESSFVAIDPFKPSVVYGLKKHHTTSVVPPRLANPIDDNPQVNRQSASLLPEPSVPPDSYIPSLDHNAHIRLPPPHEFTRPDDSTDLPHQAIIRPPPLTGWHTNSLRSSPVHMTDSIQFVNSEGPLSAVREDDQEPGGYKQ